MSFEDCIDVVRDWVIAQVYATQAWVLEWVTPLHVSGVINPRANCTYHKAGTHNGKPYYLRDDGEYFIFWYPFGLDEWWISTALDYTDAGWYRNDPNIEGAYIAHLVSGVPTVTLGYGCPKLCFVDRGDPATPDRTLPTLTQDNAWHDWDLSAIVPAGAKGVTIRLVVFPLIVGRAVQLRPNGNVNVRVMSEVISQVAGIGASIDGVCAIDNNRVIEYKLAAGGFGVVNMTIKNWWF